MFLDQYINIKNIFLKKTYWDVFSNKKYLKKQGDGDGVRSQWAVFFEELKNVRKCEKLNRIDGF
jgi:hypothetical protein